MVALQPANIFQLNRRQPWIKAFARHPDVRGNINFDYKERSPEQIVNYYNSKYERGDGLLSRKMNIALVDYLRETGASEDYIKQIALHFNRVKNRIYTQKKKEDNIPQKKRHRQGKTALTEEERIEEVRNFIKLMRERGYKAEEMDAKGVEKASRILLGTYPSKFTAGRVMTNYLKARNDKDVALAIASRSKHNYNVRGGFDENPVYIEDESHVDHSALPSSHSSDHSGPSMATFQHSNSGYEHNNSFGQITHHNTPYSSHPFTAMHSPAATPSSSYFNNHDVFNLDSQPWWDNEFK